MHLKNLDNTYQSALGELFEQMPKAVLAAIAVSALTTGGELLAEAKERVLLEWWVLHQNGIIPQKPPGAPPEDAGEEALPALKAGIEARREAQRAKAAKNRLVGGTGRQMMDFRRT